MCILNGIIPCTEELAGFDEGTVAESWPCTTALHCFTAVSMAANVSCGLPSGVRSRDKTQNCAASHIAQNHSKRSFRSIYTENWIVILRETRLQCFMWYCNKKCKLWTTLVGEVLISMPKAVARAMPSYRYPCKATVIQSTAEHNRPLTSTRLLYNITQQWYHTWVIHYMRVKWPEVKPFTSWL